MPPRSTAVAAKRPKPRKTDAAYLSIVQNAPFGIYIVDADFRLVTISAGASKVFSVVQEPVGRDLGEVMAVLWPEPFLSEVLERFRHTLATGESYRGPRTVEQRAGSGSTEAYDWNIDRITLPDGRPAVVCYFYDMTEREQQDAHLREMQERHSFLLKLSDATREVADPKQLAQATVQLLARHLDTARCVYGSVDEAGMFHLEGEWRKDHLTPMPPVLRVEDLGQLHFQQGRTVVINDTGSDARVNEEAFDEMGRIRAAIGVPLVKNGGLMAGFGVLDDKPRTWTDAEVRLVEEVCARTWAAVERARAEAALARSEEEYRSLFNSIDAGFCTVEVLFDEARRPVDYRFLSANPAFERHTGLQRVVGRTMRELVPDHDAHWFETYGRIAITGQAERFENEAMAMDRTYDVFAFRIGEPDQQQVAILFNDISERRAAETSARRSHERYQAFMHHSAEGIWRCELERPMPLELSVADMLDFAYTHAYLAECNDAMARMYGFASSKELEGARLNDLIPRTPENEAFLTAFVHNDLKLMGGESAEKHRDGHMRHFSNNLVGMVENGHVVRVWGTQIDITERKRAEADMALLALVSVDLVGVLSDSLLSQATGDRILAHFNINRISMSDVDLAAGKAHIRYDHHLPDSPCILGPRDFTGWRDQGTIARLAQGMPHVVNDVRIEPGINAEAYLSIQAGALVTIPISRDGVLVSFFSVTAAEARVWRASDLELLKELSARFWNAFERVKVEEALQHELASARLLAEVSTSVVQGDETDLLYAKITEAAAFLMGSRFASLRKYKKERGELQLMAAHGYPDETLERWRWVKPGPATTCGKALSDGSRVMVPDLETCDWLQGTEALASYRAIGIRAIQSTPLRSRDGEPIGVISTHWDRVHTPTPHEFQLFDVLARQAADLIERMRNERLLRENESRFRMATDTGRVGVWEWQIPADVVTWNDVLFDIQGVRKETFGGNVEAFANTIHPEDRERVTTTIRASLQNDLPYAVEFRAVRPLDGRVVRLVTHARVLRDAGGQPERMVGAVVDVTAMREAEEALLAADRRKDEFLATLAHELRNPLAPLRNGLEVLHTAMDDPHTVHHIRAMMERQVDQMAHLVDDLLDVSRISRGVIELRRSRMDIHRSIHQAVEGSKPLLQAKDHQLLLQLHTAPILVDADSTRLAQILGNLLDNAAKYTDRGGIIRVISRVVNGQAEVVVSDTGIGLTPEQLPKVFDMFSQVDRSNSRARGGLGIGLHIVKRLAEMHGGSIEVASQGAQQGSRFTLRIPLAVDPERPLTQHGRTASAHALRILLTDDNVDAATMVAMLLRKAGHEVVVAHSGWEALEKGPQLEPQVVILDIGMPGMDGHETCRRMRMLPWGQRAFLIALTGWGQAEDRLRSQKAGFNHHLVKPVVRADLEELLASVAT